MRARCPEQGGAQLTSQMARAASATTASAPPEVDWITAAYQKMQEKKRCVCTPGTHVLAVAYYALTATYGRALELEEQKEKRLKQQKRLEKLQEAEPDHPSA